MIPWNKTDFDDEWIMEHYSYESTWVELCRLYNDSHGTNINYSTFKSHCNQKLQLRNSYHDGLSKEQEQWLKENYPHKGEKATAVEFNEKFGTNIRAETIGTYCNRKLGLKVTDERLAVVREDATSRFIANRCHPIGTKMVRGDEGLCIKTNDGWKRCSWLALGINSLPKNHKVIHLDGDIMNNDVDNLEIISAKTWGNMSAQNFWSKNKEVTMTGLIWCELSEVLASEQIVNAR